MACLWLILMFQNSLVMNSNSHAALYPMLRSASSSLHSCVCLVAMSKQGQTAALLAKSIYHLELVIIGLIRVMLAIAYSIAMPTNGQ